MTKNASTDGIDKPNPLREDIGFERWRSNERPADLVHMRGDQDNELWWNEESLRSAWIAGRRFNLPAGEAFMRVIDLIESIKAERYGNPLIAALHLCNDLADEAARHREKESA